MSDAPSYPALIELISRLEGKDKAIAAKALYCLNRMDTKELKLFNEVQSLRERLAEADEANRRVSDENEKLRRDVRTAVMGDSAELADVKRENEKLRAALKPFADAVKDEFNWKYDINVDDLRAAAAAIRESGDE